jgi:hypothetical protein
MYICNRGETYTEDHWMRDFIKNLMYLTYEQWLGWNLVKHHRIEGTITIKTRGQLARELDRLLDKDICNMSKKVRWMLDMDPSKKALLSMQEINMQVLNARPLRYMIKLYQREWMGKRETSLNTTGCLGLRPNKEHLQT